LHEDGALEDWMLALSCQRIDEAQWPTAPGQGAISVHCATKRFEEMSVFRKVLNHTATEKEVLSEREQLQNLGGGCLFPAGIRSKSGRLNVKVSPKNWRDLHCRGERFHTLDYNGPVEDFVAQAPEQKAEPPVVVNDGRQLISTLNSERLAMRLQSEGIRVVNHPVLDLQPLKGNWPHLNLDTISDRRKWPLLLLTSPFAARCAAEISESIPEYRRIQWVAIGEGTARACFKLGITASICGRARNSKDFATYIRENIEPTNLLLLPQSNRADDSFAEALKQSGFEVQRWIGYENKTKKVDSFSSSKDDVLLLSSPSSALAWVDNSLPIASTILVMGESTKAQLEKMEQFSESNVQVLKGPTADYITQWWNETGEQ
jgi:uroporphyrinogen-III synthase